MNKKTRHVSIMGLMLAVIVAVSWLEHTLPQPPVLPPNMRLGLSNIVTMYCFFFTGRDSAALLNALKSMFVVFMRGPVAGLMSFSGGMASVLLLALLTVLFNERLSYLAAGILGAIAHNLGQLAAASVLAGTNILLAYLPVLLVFGVVAGAVTGVLMKAAIPLLDRIQKL